MDTLKIQNQEIAAGPMETQNEKENSIMMYMNTNINTPEHFTDPNFRAAVEEFMGVPSGGAFTAADTVRKTA